MSFFAILRISKGRGSQRACFGWLISAAFGSLEIREISAAFRLHLAFFRLVVNFFALSFDYLLGRFRLHLAVWLAGGFAASGLVSSFCCGLVIESVAKGPTEQ